MNNVAATAGKSTVAIPLAIVPADTNRCKKGKERITSGAGATASPATAVTITNNQLVFGFNTRSGTYNQRPARPQ
jgi:hypothetical protein